MQSSRLNAALVSISLVITCALAAPDHYGIYLGSKSELRELIGMKIEGWATGQQLAAHFQKNPVVAERDSYILVYYPDFKPSQLEFEQMSGDGGTKPVATFVKPLDKDQYAITPRAPLSDGIYLVTHNASMLNTEVFLFGVGQPPRQTGASRPETAPAQRPNSQNNNVRQVTVGDIASGVRSLFSRPKPPDDQGTLDPALENHPAAVNYREVSTVRDDPRVYQSFGEFKGVPYDAAWDALITDLSATVAKGELAFRKQDKANGVIEFVQPVGQLFLNSVLTLKSTDMADGASQLRMDIQLTAARRFVIKKADIIKEFARLMDVVKNATPPPERKPSLSAVCPKGRLGEFRYGTRVVGYYDDDQIVDIQVEGRKTTQEYQTTKQLMHAGVDMAAPEGSDLYPIASGVVTDAVSDKSDRNFRGMGYLVIVKHDAAVGGRDAYSIYLHMKDKPSVSIGDKVIAGTTRLGFVGQTGRAFGPHVHLEVRRFPERLFPGWQNIYGIVTPTRTMETIQQQFAENWIDPTTLK
jgi:murein DD-endopeptidase MepM/ murein hydrolase activator NlpD